MKTYTPSEALDLAQVVGSRVGQPGSLDRLLTAIRMHPADLDRKHRGRA